MSAGTVAVIEIGSTGVRAVIAEIDPDGAYRIIDRAEKPVAFGRDVFNSGAVSRETTGQAIAVLRGMRELLRSYGIEPKDARVIATSALREASNRDTFADRVFLRTGFSVDVIEAIEENHLMYLAVRRALGDDYRQIARSNSVILDVGGGSTEIMLLRRGKMAAAHSLRIGTVRIDEQMRAASGVADYLSRYLSDNVRTTCDMLDADLPLSSVRTFIVLGGDARTVARAVGQATEREYAVVTRANFIRFVDALAGLSPEDIVERFRLRYDEAEAFAPGLTVARLFLERTSAEDLVVPLASMRDGLLVDLAGGPDSKFRKTLDAQVLASAVSLGRKYRFDEAHSKHVASLAATIFDRLASEHGLGRRERLLLEAAAILHDVGTFIRSGGHHRHSEYIVLNSELFGLHLDDQVIVANCVRYHRKAGPNSSHPNFMGLSREDRTIVRKLAAILRVADSLDRGHSQSVSITGAELREDRLVLATESRGGDLSLERVSLAEKGDMFEDVFGLKVMLS
ncbi:MAG: HD domain-containing protein [Spirochaetes bacterium]|nr:HD domain-containing protein [Spirochaetota bacterium]